MTDDPTVTALTAQDLEDAMRAVEASRSEQVVVCPPGLGEAIALEIEESGLGEWFTVFESPIVPTNKVFVFPKEPPPMVTERRLRLVTGDG